MTSYNTFDVGLISSVVNSELKINCQRQKRDICINRPDEIVSQYRKVQPQFSTPRLLMNDDVVTARPTVAKCQTTQSLLDRPT